MLCEGKRHVRQRDRQMTTGQRRKESPKSSWDNCAKEDMREIRAKDEDAQDRMLWRNLICTGDSSNGN